jgi:hypothetical protein
MCAKSGLQPIPEMTRSRGMTRPPGLERGSMHVAISDSAIAVAAVAQISGDVFKVNAAEFERSRFEVAAFSSSSRRRPRDIGPR